MSVQASCVSLLRRRYSMPGFDQARPSLRTGEETTITFINHSRASINLHWMTSDGNRQPYAKVPVGEQHVQHTYAGHVWMVSDDAGKPLKFFEAVEGGAEAIIEDTVPEKATEEHKSAEKLEPPKLEGVSPDGHWRAFIRNNNLFVRN